MSVAGVTCDGCAFWEPIAMTVRNGLQLGQCRRNAPVLDVGGAVPKSRWPLTVRTDFCGEHAVPAAPETD